MSEHTDPHLIERIRSGIERFPARDFGSPAAAMARGRWRRRVALLRASVLGGLLGAAIILPLLQLSGLRSSPTPVPATQVPQPSVGPGLFHVTGTPPPPGAHCSTPPRSVSYRVGVQPLAGPPGSRVVVTGNTPLFSMSGRYVGPSGKIGFWFNLPPNGWEQVYGNVPPASNQGSQVIQLGEANVHDRCSYRVTFTVPALEPGIYPLVLIEHNGGGASPLDTVDFRVESSANGSLGTPSFAPSPNRFGPWPAQAPIVATIRAPEPPADSVLLFKPIFRAAYAKACPNQPGFEPLNDSRFSSFSPHGRTIQIRCADGTVKAVSLIFSGVVVPDLMSGSPGGMNGLQGLLSMLGLHWRSVRRPATATQQPGAVVAQRPLPGVVVPFGTVVTYVVAR